MTLQQCIKIVRTSQRHAALIYIVNPVLSGHLWDKVKVALYDGCLFKRGSIYMKFSMIKQTKRWHFNTDYWLIEVAVWTGLTVFDWHTSTCSR
jgi:hypothetical protein